MSTASLPPGSCPFNINTSEAVNGTHPDKIYAEYDLMRQNHPLAYTTQYSGFWVLTRYHDIKAAASDSSLFISSRGAVVPSDPRGIRRAPLNYDPPEHTPYRRALDRTLKPVRLKRLESVLEQHADEELAKMVAKGGGDICAEFGARYSAWVETEWLNLDPEIAPVLASTAAAWVNAWREQDREVVNAKSEALYQIARSLLSERKKRPRNPEEDPASSLLLERDKEGEALDEEQLM